MPFSIVRDDITRVRADAIVNTANPRPTVGGGTDWAVYHAAGEQALMAAREKIGEIAPGQTAVTPAFALPARYILHTASVPWTDGRQGEEEILRSCYRTALAAAAKLDCESVAFPLLAAGSYGWPRELALETAVSEIRAFLETSEMTVILVVFDPDTFGLSAARLGEIRAYIDEHGVTSRILEEYGEGQLPRRRRPENAFTSIPDSGPDEAAQPMAADALPELAAPKKKPVFLQGPPLCVGPKPRPAAPAQGQSAAPAQARPEPRRNAPESLPPHLSDFLKHRGQTFQQRLFQLIDESGMNDVQVYKKANIDRKVFSRIRCKADYRPKKTTAVAFAIALRLDMDTMTDLLARAEIALSPSSEFDLIITWFVSRGNYDIYEINEALFQFGQPLLGA